VRVDRDGAQAAALIHGQAITRFRGRTVERPWGPMRVYEAGEGPSLLAVHGLGGSGRYWQGLVDAVGSRFRVIAPDLAGFGASGKPDVAYDRPMQLANLDAAIESGGSGDVVVVAHSLGAVFATLWAARRADRVLGLACAAGAWPSADGGPGWARDERRPPLPFRVAGRAVRAAWPLVAVPVGALRGYPAGVTIDFGRQTLRSRTRTLVAAVYDPVLSEELAGAGAELTRARVPQLLVNARDDRTVHHASQDRWAEILPDAERRTVETGGHQFLLRDAFEPLASWLLALPAG
jgi:pimeloyl-ACP methyl ester carboxylesterase